MIDLDGLKLHVLGVGLDNNDRSSNQANKQVVVDTDDDEGLSMRIGLLLVLRSRFESMLGSKVPMKWFLLL